MLDVNLICLGRRGVLNELEKVVRRHVEIQGISQFAKTSPASERPKRPRIDMAVVELLFSHAVGIKWASRGGILDAESVRHVSLFVAFPSRASQHVS